MKRLYTKAEIDLLIELYPNTLTADIAKRIGRSSVSVSNKAHELGLNKSPGFMSSRMAGRFNSNQECSKKTQFKPGHIAWNKGKKFDAGGKAIATRFQKGHTNTPHLPLGSERFEDGIRYRKVNTTGDRKTDWRSVHSVVWEEHNGPIPDGHVVIFENGNREDSRIENLKLVTRKELLARNSIVNYPKDVRDTIRTLTQLKRTIKRRSTSHEKQN